MGKNLRIWMPRKILGLFFIGIGVLFARPDIWDNYDKDPVDVHAQDLYARTFREAFSKGEVHGHGGFFAQHASNLEPSFTDFNLSLAYDTRRWKGYKVGVEAWLNALIFQAVPDSFRRNKDVFILTNLYLDFYNQYEKFWLRLGRYKINEEWITHNTQGFSLDYEGVDFWSLNFTWSLGNAYVENYFACGFGGCDSFKDRLSRTYNVIGAFYLKSAFTLPNFPLKITPYIYSAPGIFFTTALKLDLDLPFRSVKFLNSMQTISYVGSRLHYGEDAGSGFLFMLDSSVLYRGLRGGIGVSATNSSGANLIDAFGQNTPFERPVGMFYGNSNTIYGYIQYSMQYVNVSAGIRNSFMKVGNVFHWELKTVTRPVFKLKGLEFGLALIGLNNTSEALDYFGGKRYFLVRGFVQYRF